ncbi:ABC transporter substrate-binding protein [Streptomyces malaysiensis]|uniref:ABC transporter substrate-binding protein n=1 Tax=Streptomyces malaysiensis TaxID=92644 RepID=UPI002B2C4A80|nr:ABC transporter substrate-binding protein [Streptomyces malaysiensis]
MLHRAPRVPRASATSSTRPARRRPLAPIALATALLTLLTACSAATGSGGDATTVRVGNVCGGINPSTIATDAETFPSGTKVKKICFDGGAEALQALIGGSIDVFIGSPEHIVSARSKDLPVRGYAALSRRVPYSLVTKADSGIRGVKDLRDKTVAVTSVGSLSDTELLKAAADADIPYKGLKVINGGVGASIVAAIDKGAAAGMVSDPQLTQLVHSGKYRVVWKPDFDYVSLVALANTSWVDKHRALMTDYLRGLTTAEDKSRADRSFAVKALAKEKFAVSPGVLDEATAQAIANTPKGLKIDGGVYRKTIDVLVQTGRIPADRVPDFADAFDFSLLKSS